MALRVKSIGGTLKATHEVSTGHSPVVLQSLSNELMMDIFKLLGAKEANCKRRTCRDWNILLSDNVLWHTFLRRDFGHTEKAENPRGVYKRYVACSNLITSTYVKRTWDNDNDSDEYCRILAKDGRLFSANCDAVIRMRDLKSGECLKTLDCAKVLGSYSSFLFIRCMALTKDRGVATGHANGVIYVWDLENGVCKWTFNSRVGKVNALAVTKAGKLTSAHADGTIIVWDLSTGKPAKILKKHREAIIFFTEAKNKRLISASDDGAIMIWNLDHLEDKDCCEATLQLKGRKICAAVLTKAGDLISGSTTGEIDFWDLATGVCKRTLAGNSDNIKFLGLTEGEKYLISSDCSGIVHIWNIAQGLKENTIQESGRCLNSMALTEEGQLILGSFPMLQILDFAVSNHAVLENLAAIFESDDADEHEIARERFLRMPEALKTKILDDFYAGSRPFIDDCSYAEKDAIFGPNGQWFTPHQTARAIRSYLKPEEFKRKVRLGEDEPHSRA